MENYRNKMLRILNEMAAKGRCPNRFCDSKRGLSFSIFNSPFSINSSLFNALHVYDNICLHSEPRRPPQSFAEAFSFRRCLCRR